MFTKVKAFPIIYINFFRQIKMKYYAKYLIKYFSYFNQENVAKPQEKTKKGIETSEGLKQMLETRNLGKKIGKAIIFGTNQQQLWAQYKGSTSEWC
jgi:hypothetical protein